MKRPSKRKRCKVWVYPTGESEQHNHGRIRCEGKIKPGTPFCKEHFETHRLIRVECTGEAHTNPWIDNCGVCAPFWGYYPVAVPKDQPLKEGQQEWIKETWG